MQSMCEHVGVQLQVSDLNFLLLNTYNWTTDVKFIHMISWVISMSIVHALMASFTMLGFSLELVRTCAILVQSCTLYSDHGNVHRSKKLKNAAKYGLYTTLENTLD